MLIKFAYYAQNYAQEQELCLVYYHYLYTNMDKQVTTHNRQFRKTVLLGCIYKWLKNTLYVLLDNDRSITVYQSFAAIFQNYSYYAGIMLNAFSDLLCSKLCWHNWLVPTPDPLVFACMCMCFAHSSYVYM